MKKDEGRAMPGPDRIRKRPARRQGQPCTGGRYGEWGIVSRFVCANPAVPFPGPGGFSIVQHMAQQILLFVMTIHVQEIPEGTP